MIDIARSLEPLIRRCEDELEQGRRMPAELVDALYEAGVFLAFTPREVGGREVDPLPWLDMIEELSRINGSVGWNAFINAGQTTLAPETMRGILAGERWITAGSIGRAAGRARRDGGGYRITGRWPFTSGAPFATYLYVASLVYDDRGEPVMDERTGAPALVTGVIPASRATIHDNWDGLGLRGTGSVDVEVDDVFVPDEYVAGQMLVAPYGGPLFRGPQFLLMGHAAHVLGIARCALDAFVELVHRAQARPDHGSRRQVQLGQRQADQVAMARAESLVRSARLFAWDAVARAWEDAREHESIAYELRVLMAQSIIHAARAAKEAVDLVFERAGTSGVHRGQTLERCYRDISTAAQHTLMVETTYDSIGQYYLTRGLPGGPVVEGMLAPILAAPGR